MGRGFKPTTTADADLWTAMLNYRNEWGHKTRVFWVKVHAEESGWPTDSRANENKKPGEDAEKAYAHLGTPQNREEYCSQFNTMYGTTTEGEVVVHKMGATAFIFNFKIDHLLRGVGRPKIHISGWAVPCSV